MGGADHPSFPGRQRNGRRASRRRGVAATRNRLGGCPDRSSDSGGGPAPGGDLPRRHRPRCRRQLFRDRTTDSRRLSRRPGLPFPDRVAGLQAMSLVRRLVRCRRAKRFKSSAAAIAGKPATKRERGPDAALRKEFLPSDGPSGRRAPDRGQRPAREKAKQFPTEREARAWARSIGSVLEAKRVTGGAMTVDSYFTFWLDFISAARAGSRKRRAMSIATIWAGCVPHRRHQTQRAQPLSSRRCSSPGSAGAADGSVAAHDLPCGPNRGHRLKAARRWRFITASSLEDIERLSPGKKKAKAPTPEQLRAYLAHVRPTEFWPVVLTAIGTGLRRGELLGLAWPAVDLNRRILQVRQTMWDAGARFGLRPAAKTAAGFRTIALPPIVVATLAALRNAQEAELSLYGPAYRDDLTSSSRGRGPAANGGSPPGSRAASVRWRRRPGCRRASPRCTGCAMATPMPSCAAARASR